MTSESRVVVPFHREWMVILRDEPKGQVVLYDTQQQEVTVRPLASNSRPNICAMCGHVLSSSPSTNLPNHGTHASAASDLPPSSEYPDLQPRVFMDSKYFQLLEATSKRNAPQVLSDPAPMNAASDAHLPETVFNEGYYARFFREIRRLGRGYRGSVFLCQHALDNVILGEYAIKKIPVGDNKKWLKRMLGEVRILEGIRHSNITEYKHCWLEDHQLTNFGPPVPCLFILMELANGGNLEEYVTQRTKVAEEDPMQKAKERRRRLNSGSADTTEGLLSEKRFLSVPEIWSFFLDICSGLNHLHRHGIIHRDLKPSNLLLKFKSGSEIPRVLISDFGECEDLFDNREIHKRSGHTGTLEFTAPEMLRVDRFGNYFAEYSSTADIWSLGMILYYLCYAQLPYKNLEDIDVLKKEILGFWGLSLPEMQVLRSDIPPEMLRLMRLLLSHNPRERPSAATILKTFRPLRDTLVSGKTTPNTESPLRRSLPNIVPTEPNRRSITPADFIRPSVVTSLLDRIISFDSRLLKCYALFVIKLVWTVHACEERGVGFLFLTVFSSIDFLLTSSDRNVKEGKLTMLFIMLAVHGLLLKWLCPTCDTQLCNALNVSTLLTLLLLVLAYQMYKKS